MVLSSLEHLGLDSEQAGAALAALSLLGCAAILGVFVERFGGDLPPLPTEYDLVKVGNLSAIIAVFLFMLRVVDTITFTVVVRWRCFQSERGKPDKAQMEPNCIVTARKSDSAVCSPSRVQPVAPPSWRDIYVFLQSTQDHSRNRVFLP